MSLRLRLLRQYLRRIEKPWLERLELEAGRTAFERSARWLWDPPFALYREAVLGGVPVTWASAGPCPRPEVILYLHGGTHLMGSARTHRAMVARLSAMTGVQAVLPDYRLAPEAPFPASLEDAHAAWDGLRRLGWQPGQILLGGDSSGGAVMLSLLAERLAAGERPLAAVGLAPLTDHTGAGASMRENAETDWLLPPSRLAEVCALYLAGADPRDPRASPLYAQFPGCPPVFLQVARTEILRDDTLRMADHLRAEGTEVEVDLWDDCPHVWPIFQGWLPEADAALSNIARFIRERLPPLPPPAES